VKVFERSEKKFKGEKNMVHKFKEDEVVRFGRKYATVAGDAGQDMVFILLPVNREEIKRV
jgi:hypothetical protein